MNHCLILAAELISQLGNLVVQTFNFLIFFKKQGLHCDLRSKLGYNLWLFDCLDKLSCAERALANSVSSPMLSGVT